MVKLGPEVTRRSGPAFWAWFLQRITAILLLPLLFLHMIVNHYMDPSTAIQVKDVEANVRMVSFFVVDHILLLFGLFHGLNGARNVAYDYLNEDRHRKLVNIALVIVGVVTYVYGSLVLLIVAGVI